jgi:hypothetical protein
MLIADLEEFVADHRQHGPMNGDASLLTIACPCGRHLRALGHAGGRDGIGYSPIFVRGGIDDD